MELNHVLDKRHSVRHFTNKKVPWRDAIEIVDAATKTPIAGGRNHLRCIIIEESETINALAKLADQSWMAHASIIIVITSDDKSLEAMYGDRGRIYSRQQAGAAIQNALLKATDLGIGACWIGAYDDHKIRHLLKISKSSQIEALIPLGYENPSSHKPRTKKRELENFIRWENFETSKRPSMYKE
ncbi:MAG: nitroreductase family protein [Nanoarchaeota archaeon]